jgi:ribonucleoside-diphosphate reductase alpha chain
MGFTKNPDIKIAKSIVDYIFRWLGVQFLPGYREANKAIGNGAHDSHETAGSEQGDTGSKVSKPAATTASGPNAAQGSAKPNGQASNGTSAAISNGPHFNGNGKSKKPAAAVPVLERAGLMIAESSGSASTRDEQFASFQTDAPSCDNCGAITVRNGNCYLCHNCGNSMGCS